MEVISSLQAMGLTGFRDTRRAQRETVSRLCAARSMARSADFARLQSRGQCERVRKAKRESVRKLPVSGTARICESKMTRLHLLALVLGLVVVPLACGRPQGAVSPAPAPPLSAEQRAMWSEAQGVFETRCVVCHGCYDAPCQLKLGTYDGIARGASGDKVYDSTRLVAASPTRLDIDAHETEGWRKKGFHPVLPEGTASDPRASLLLRMLDLKRAYPLPAMSNLTKEFTLELDRKETCATAEHFEDYAKNHPLWGMP
jgi:hypothetical protein